MTALGDADAGVQLSRSSLKADMTPSMLPAGLREDYARMTAISPAHLETSMRPGCTHLSATCLHQVSYVLILSWTEGIASWCPLYFQFPK